MKNKGITLVSLVVTIIVMLVLAGVSIALSVGPSGVMSKARDSQIDTKYSTIIDRVNIRENDMAIAIEKGEGDDPKLDHLYFIDELKDEGLFENGVDAYDSTNKKLYIGPTDNGTHTYGGKKYKYMLEIKQN